MGERTVAGLNREKDKKSDSLRKERAKQDQTGREAKRVFDEASKLKNVLDDVSEKVRGGLSKIEGGARGALTSDAERTQKSAKDLSQHGESTKATSRDLAKESSKADRLKSSDSRFGSHQEVKDAIAKGERETGRIAKEALDTSAREKEAARRALDTALATIKRRPF